MSIYKFKLHQQIDVSSKLKQMQQIYKSTIRKIERKNQQIK